MIFDKVIYNYLGCRYYCTAENDLGSSTTNISVGVNLSPRLPRHDDLRSCCKNEGVEDATCLEICTFNLDLDLLSFEVSNINF